MTRQTDTPTDSEPSEKPALALMLADVEKHSAAYKRMGEI